MPAPTPTLFDGLPPNVGRTDSGTSRLAADQMEQTGARQRQCEVVLLWVRANPGLTAPELSAAMPAGERLDRYQINRRLSDLKNAGLVVPKNPRICRASGGARPMMEWWPVEPRTE